MIFNVSTHRHRGMQEQSIAPKSSLHHLQGENVLLWREALVLLNSMGYARGLQRNVPAQKTRKPLQNEASILLYPTDIPVYRYNVCLIPTSSLFPRWHGCWLQFRLFTHFQDAFSQLNAVFKVMTCNSTLSACAAVTLWRWSLELYRCLQSHLGVAEIHWFLRRSLQRCWKNPKFSSKVGNPPKKDIGRLYLYLVRHCISYSRLEWIWRCAWFLFEMLLVQIQHRTELSDTRRPNMQLRRLQAVLCLAHARDLGSGWLH